MRARVGHVVIVAALAPLLAGCGFLTMIGIPVEDDATKASEGAAPQKQATPAAPAAPTTPPARPSALDISGHWTGTTRFTSYTMLLPESPERATWEAGVAGTIGRDYPIEIDAAANGEARLTFDGKTVVSGSFTQNGESVTFVFKKAGSDELAVGASPPVSFTFTGTVESESVSEMSGTVLYEVFTKDGATAWTETGEWLVTP